MERRSRSDQDGQRRRGRPPAGADLIEGRSGSETARQRLAAILRTLSGEWTIEQASSALGISRSRFHDMRSEFVEEAIALLEPRTPGPKPHVRTEAEHQMQALRARLAELELEVHTTRVREELAAAMPQILVPKIHTLPRAGEKRQTDRR